MSISGSASQPRRSRWRRSHQSAAAIRGMPKKDPNVGPREREPDDDDGRVRCPPEKAVFLDIAPQRDGKFHGGPHLLRCRDMIGARDELVHPLCGVPR